MEIITYFTVVNIFIWYGDANSGVIPSENTRVEVIFDNALMVTGSSIVPVSVVDSLYTFNVGTIQPGECKRFTIDAFLDCESNAGDTYCATAHIYPDSFCVVDPSWDGSIIEADATCENGMVRLILRNKGSGDMTNTINYVIAEDIIMLSDPGDNQIILDSNEEQVVFETNGNGKTYRLIAEQSTGYPGLSYPTAAVEGCGTDTAGTYSTGFYTMFPDDEQDAFVASDCQESYETDFNSIYFKRGHPKGYDVPHYISPQTDLDYLIYFRNTGSETVDQVIVRDTLSQFLDPTTVYPGASSHPYEFQVYGDGIVQFTINNANLIPDEGEGFVSFRVSQIEDEIPCNTELINTAAIYFDFNAPVVTNEVFHTICERDSFLVVNTEKIYIPTADVNISPNPFVESTQFEITGINASQYLLEVYDIQGRLLFNQYYPNPTFRLFKSQVPSSGVHIFRIVADGRPVASGKILALD
ncbi:MAG: T9SS type A sorting domain-containing protein [Saprospiraceae bacterium]